jgi:hypothetical protein
MGAFNGRRKSSFHLGDPHEHLLVIAHNDLPEAPQLLVELNNGEIEVKHGRIEYDIEAVSARIRRLGIPEMLTSRLFQSL